MPRKKRRLDQFLNQRKKKPEVVLEEKTRLSNRLFRFVVGAVLALLVGLLTLLDGPETPTYPIGIGLLFLIFTILGVLFLNRLRPGVFDRPASFNKFVLLFSLTVAICFFIRFMGWSPFLLPVTMLAMVATMAYGQEVSLFATLAICLFIGLSSPDARQWEQVGPMPKDLSGVRLPFAQDFPLDVPVVLTLLTGALATILGVRHVRKQSKPFGVGVLAGSVQALTYVATLLLLKYFVVDVLAKPPVLRGVLEQAGWCLAGGVIWGAVVTCLLPLIERFFEVLTERRLLDLADPSNDLLRILRERAPGTYQHTLGVAQLAGNAAEAIGANGLLVEVGAYYHDIGKIFKPEYFVENMGEDRSIHDRLRPSMSKMVIISHVKDGMDLAREARLPQKIIDMIPMHHGTTVVEYFFRKARREAEQTAEAPTADTEYRYPGSKPRFREAGILMLADMIEAIAKTETDPHPARFRSMVHAQIHKRLLDGQLNESDLTLNDLRIAEDSFVRTLTNMYHSRIKYPEPEATRSQAPVEGVASGVAMAQRASHPKE